VRQISKLKRLELSERSIRKTTKKEVL